MLQKTMVLLTGQKEAVAKDSEFTIKYYIRSKDLNAIELLDSTHSHWLVNQ